MQHAVTDLFQSLCVCRFTGDASTSKTATAVLGCLYSHHPHPQQATCVASAFTHAMSGARAGGQLPVLTSGALPGLSHHETTLAENHPVRTQCESESVNMLVWLLIFIYLRHTCLSSIHSSLL